MNSYLRSYEFTLNGHVAVIVVGGDVLRFVGRDVDDLLGELEGCTRGDEKIDAVIGRWIKRGLEGQRSEKPRRCTRGHRSGGAAHVRRGDGDRGIRPSAGEPGIALLQHDMGVAAQDPVLRVVENQPEGLMCRAAALNPARPCEQRRAER